MSTQALSKGCKKFKVALLARDDMKGFLSLLLFAFAAPGIQALVCNASAYSVSLNHTQCFGLSEIPNKQTYSDCFSACCSINGMMFEFCESGTECGTYLGPSCWCGSSNLQECNHSPTINWLGASQTAPPPPTPPISQNLLPSGSGYTAFVSVRPW